MEEMTIKELLQLTADQIADIVVPVRYGEQIAKPLCQAVANIRAVIAAIPDPAENEQTEVDDDVQRES